MKTQKKLTPAARLTEGLSAARRQLVEVEQEIVAEARKQRQALEKVLGRVTNGAQLKTLERRVSTTAADLQRRVRSMPREVLGALGVATSDDVSKLSKSVSKLTKRVDALSKART